MGPVVIRKDEDVVALEPESAVLRGGELVKGRDDSGYIKL